MECLRTDAAFMEILHEQKTITGFLDAVFGFLRRNTDFYYIKTQSDERIGFTKGIREQIVFGAMQRYDPDCILNNLTAESSEADDVYAPPAISEVEIETEDVVAENELENDVSTTPAKDAKIAAAQQKIQNTDFTATDYKNGACFSQYCWSQTLHDVELQVKLPSELQNAKLICIEIKPDRISVRSRHNSEKVIVSGQLSNRVKHNNTVWTITEGKLSISLDKSKEIWWDKLFSIEDAIDLKKIDCERYIDELPVDSQMAIQKLRCQQVDQDNSNLGHHNTEYGKDSMERLRAAWDAEGSPFKGQPFDPSIVKFS